MKEFRIGNAIVRIHGEPDTENVKKAAEVFAKKIFVNKATRNVVAEVEGVKTNC